MHMPLVIVGGIVVLGVFMLFGRLWGSDISGMAVAAKVFIPVWLIIALVNMWIGVTKAGYTVAQELPILLVNFIIPAAIAAFATWQLTRG